MVHPGSCWKDMFPGEAGMGSKRGCLNAFPRKNPEESSRHLHMNNRFTEFSRFNLHQVWHCVLHAHGRWWWWGGILFCGDLTVYKPQWVKAGRRNKSSEVTIKKIEKKNLTSTTRPPIAEMIVPWHMETQHSRLKYFCRQSKRFWFLQLETAQDVWNSSVFQPVFRSVKTVNKISPDVKIALACFMTALCSNNCNYAEALLSILNW